MLLLVMLASIDTSRPLEVVWVVPQDHREFGQLMAACPSQ